ncbi:MAG: DUF58 domain-containing protein, partial [Candidatus Tectomicrobia bacterium]|nr:DUF58 domain-containing protein [Candidatus Tectomicrobia bacterium]
MTNLYRNVATFLRQIMNWLRPPRRLKFTREGVLFVLLTIGVGAAAINTGINLLYLVLAMMLSVIMASGILSEASLRQIGVKRSFPASTFAGETIDVRVMLTNRKRRIPSFSLEILDEIPPSVSQEKKESYLLKIEAGKTAHLKYRLKVERRGLYQFQSLVLLTRFPFALFQKSRTYELPETFLVYPRLISVDPLFAMSSHEKFSTTQRGKVTKGGGGEGFYALREYREGDNPRWVHWKSSARLGKLLVREFAKEPTEKIAVLFHASSSVESDELEWGISYAASLMYTFMKQHRPLFFATYEPDFAIVRPHDTKPLEQILRILALFTPPREKTFSQLLSEVKGEIPQDAGIIGMHMEGENVSFSRREGRFALIDLKAEYKKNEREGERERGRQGEWENGRMGEGETG